MSGLIDRVASAIAYRSQRLDIRHNLQQIGQYSSEAVDRHIAIFGLAKVTDYHRELARDAIAATRDLPEEPGPRYTAGEYSRRTQEAMVDDALGHPRCP